MSSDNARSARRSADNLCRNLKRDRDEEDSEDSDAENDENENVQAPSKKRRIAGYYGTSSLVTLLHLSHIVVLTRDSGANGENAPLASASQAECDVNEINEDDESSRNRPLSPALEHPIPEDEDERGEWNPSFHAGDINRHGGFDDKDADMVDVSDEEEKDENAVPAPKRAALGSAVTLPLLPAPVIVSTTRAQRARALRRQETMVIGGQTYRLGDELPDDC